MCGAGRPTARYVRVAVAALVVCACLEACWASPQRDLRSYPRSLISGGTYCGSRLADALKFICNGQYNSYFKTKKTVDKWSKSESQQGKPQDRSRRAVDEPVEEVPVEQVPFQDRIRAAALLESRPSHARVTRGVFDECCSKACTYDELMNYCEVKDD